MKQKHSNSGINGPDGVLNSSTDSCGSGYRPNFEAAEPSSSRNRNRKNKRRQEDQIDDVVRTVVTVSVCRDQWTTPDIGRLFRGLQR